MFGKKQAPPGTELRANVLDEIAEFSKQKAAIRSQELAITEALKYGKIHKNVYDEYKINYVSQIKLLDKKIDERINLIADAYFRDEFAKEAAVTQGKLEYMVELDKRQKAQRAEISLLKANVDELSRENVILKERIGTFAQKRDPRIEDLKAQVLQMKKEVENTRKKPDDSYSCSHIEEKLEKSQGKMEEYYHKNLLFDLLVKRYGKYIEEHETKTIQDLKELVQPRNTNVVEIVNKITSEIPEYSPQKDLPKAAEKAYKFVVENIHSVPSLGVNFWMSIREVLDNYVADYEDKAILLCSLFRALGAEASVGITEFTDGSNRPLVFLKFKEYEVLCDPNEAHEFSEYAGSRDEIIRLYTINGKTITKILYEFDDKDYKEY